MVDEADLNLLFYLGDKRICQLKPDHGHTGLDVALADVVVSDLGILRHGLLKPPHKELRQTLVRAENSVPVLAKLFLVTIFITERLHVQDG